MSFAHKIKKQTQPNTLIAVLNHLLASTIDFKLSAKQAHWNVTGENFIALHELFDEVSSKVDGYADMLAERSVQLGGTAQGTLQTVSSQSSLGDYPVDIHDGREHVMALSGEISVLADASRQGINAASDVGDMVTADLLTEITRGLDKLHWFIRSHLV
ncbi:MAG: DNA starvation/stationary phase protection protein Dps [Proteobacteria bacterium]|nr:DNA starvation/stationary phase protection protein Dps [Pseudomonadota bacterium]